MAAIFAVSVAPCAAAPVEIQLLARAQIHGPQVQLGDVAALTTTDLRLLRTLMAVPLGSTPSPGMATRIDRERLEEWVSARAGIGGPSIGGRVSPLSLRWKGAEEVEVSSAAQQLPGESVVMAAQQGLSRWLAQYSEQVEIQAASTVRDLVLPPGTAQLRVRPISGAPARRMLVWVDAWVDNRYIRTAAVSFEVNAWVAARVPMESMARGAEVGDLSEQSGFQESQVNLAALSRAPLTPQELKPNGQRLRRPARAGEPLTSSHIEPVPAVARGSWAQMDIRTGEIRVQSRVEVLQDGRLGDIVRVRAPGGSAPVMAKVAAPGVVEVAP